MGDSRLSSPIRTSPFGLPKKERRKTVTDFLVNKNLQQMNKIVGGGGGAGGGGSDDGSAGSGGGVGSAGSGDGGGSDRNVKKADEGKLGNRYHYALASGITGSVFYKPLPRKNHGWYIILAKLKIYEKHEFG